MAGIGFLRTILSACTAAALAIGAVGSAQAREIKFGSSFDPDYDNAGQKYNGAYGFRGEAVFSVDSSCLELDYDNPYYVKANSENGAGNCGTIKVLSASLTIYEKASLGVGGGSDYANLQTKVVWKDEWLTTDGASAKTATTDPFVYGIVVKNGKVDGVVTNYFGGNGSDFESDGFVLDPMFDSTTFREYLWMRFADGRVSDSALDETRELGAGVDPVLVCDQISAASAPTTSCSGNVSNPATLVTFTRLSDSTVPEPSSLALVALALGACGTLAGRRRAASTTGR